MEFTETKLLGALSAQTLSFASGKRTELIISHEVTRARSSFLRKKK